jgi:hypothetical protein
VRIGVRHAACCLLWAEIDQDEAVVRGRQTGGASIVMVVLVVSVGGRLSPVALSNSNQEVRSSETCELVKGSGLKFRTCSRRTAGNDEQFRRNRNCPSS